MEVQGWDLGRNTSYRVPIRIIYKSSQSPSKTMFNHKTYPKKTYSSILKFVFELLLLVCNLLIKIKWQQEVKSFKVQKELIGITSYLDMDTVI
jgi:hypothetical protein